MNILNLQIVYEYNSVTALDIWRAIAREILNVGLDLNTCRLYDEDIGFKDVEVELKQSCRPSFLVDFKGLSFRFSEVRNRNHCLVEIKCNQRIELIWDSWVLALAKVGTGFISAWLSDVDYAYWQNAEDVLLYKQAEKSYTHLNSYTKNGREYVDVSANPGRRILRMNYVEAVGATMWLGALFWKLTNCKKECILDSEWMNPELMEGSILKIKVSDHCFCRSDEESTLLQNRLRFALYSKAPVS